MKILLVEDARIAAAVISARLRNFGFEVVHAENGKIAVDIFNEVAPDLILMDMDMPVMNGFEATSQIRAFETKHQWAWTPILFLTASDSPENLVTAIEAGADDFLTKSVPEAVLHAKMKAMARIAALRQQLSLANQKLYEQANRDGLTGLFNRRHMDLQTDLVWDDAKNNHQPFAVLMLDIDNFKKFNDHYGHQAGDDCLRNIANVLSQVVAQANEQKLTTNAFVSRYGGEEFAVVIPKASVAAYEKVAQVIIERIRHLSIVHEKNASWGIVTASLGGARLSVPDNLISSIFRVADARLYYAKKNGRNRAELSVATPVLPDSVIIN